jgi:diaminopimelate decarboxylase
MHLRDVTGNVTNDLKLSGCRTVLNGNGKLPWELKEAAKQGVLINIDSEFDLANITAAAKAAGTPVKLLLRINPDVDPKVRPKAKACPATSQTTMHAAGAGAHHVCSLHAHRCEGKRPGAPKNTAKIGC